MAIENKTNVLLALALAGAIGAGFYFGRVKEDTRAPQPAPVAGQPTTPAAPAAPVATPLPLKNPHMIASAAAIQQEDWETARKEMEQVEPTDPEYGSALHNLGVVYEKLGNPEASRNAFRKLLSLTQVDPDSWIGLGWAHFQLGEYLDAERATLRGVELRPEDAGARYNLALYRLAQRRIGEAIDAYQRALGYDRDQTGFATAVRDLRRYAEAHLENPDTSYALAYLFGAIQEHELEVGALEAYLERAPDGSVREQAQARLAVAKQKAAAAKAGRATNPTPGLESK